MEIQVMSSKKLLFLSQLIRLCRSLYKMIKKGNASTFTFVDFLGADAWIQKCSPTHLKDIEEAH